MAKSHATRFSALERGRFALQNEVSPTAHVWTSDEVVQ
jgi:hypothetical protein